MSELQTFTVDSEALSLLASVTSRESATDPEELPSAESSALAQSCCVKYTAHTQFIWIHQLSNEEDSTYLPNCIPYRRNKKS
eukprot:scaffold155246_cov32-Attheya_sp.AAC.1